MHYKTNILLTLAISCLTSSLPAGVIVLAEVPESLKKLIEVTQKKIGCYLDAQLENQKSKILFEKSTYDPHITLAYISDAKMTMTQLNKAVPTLQADLAAIAKKGRPINMSHSINNVYLETWDGKNPSNYNGSVYRNYKILVIKIDATPQLQEFAKSLDKLLEKYPTIQKRQFPFNPHITIGWVYDVEDIDATPMAQELKPLIEDALEEFKGTSKKFIINEFILATDKSEQKFKFTQPTKTSTTSQPSYLRRTPDRGPFKFLDCLKEGIQLPNGCCR